MFGINVVLEIFQNVIEEIFIGLLGCKNIFDDIIVFGVIMVEYDQNFYGVLIRF